MLQSGVDFSLLQLHYMFLAFRSFQSMWNRSVMKDVVNPQAVIIMIS